MDDLAVAVETVEPGGSVWTGTGYILDEDGLPGPDLITFGGDWRMMSAILDALGAGEDPIALVPSWAVLARARA
jgi:hypothetical protein